MRRPWRRQGTGRGRDGTESARSPNARSADLAAAIPKGLRNWNKGFPTPWPKKATVRHASLKGLRNRNRTQEVTPCERKVRK